MYDPKGKGRPAGLDGPDQQYQPIASVANDNLVLSQNVRSIMRNGDRLKELLHQTTNVVCVALQETWSPKIIPTFPGYDLIIRKRENKNGGGVGFLVNKHHKYKVITSPFKEGDLETIAIDITVGQSIHRIINVYKPPNFPKGNFLESLHTLPLAGKGSNMIMGDLNIDTMTQSGDDLILAMAELGLWPLIHSPTRVQKGTQSCIDHIFTDMKGTDGLILETDVSDHYMIGTKWTYQRKKNQGEIQAKASS